MNLSQFVAQSNAFQKRFGAIGSSLQSNVEGFICKLGSADLLDLKWGGGLQSHLLTPLTVPLSYGHALSSHYTPSLSDPTHTCASAGDFQIAIS